jgi:hypothetical protein
MSYQSSSSLIIGGFFNSLSRGSMKAIKEIKPGPPAGMRTPAVMRRPRSPRALRVHVHLDPDHAAGLRGRDWMPKHSGRRAVAAIRSPIGDEPRLTDRAPELRLRIRGFDEILRAGLDGGLERFDRRRAVGAQHVSSRRRSNVSDSTSMCGQGDSSGIRLRAARRCNPHQPPSLAVTRRTRQSPPTKGSQREPFSFQHEPVTR